jgi:hypothetical protein
VIGLVLRVLVSIIGALWLGIAGVFVGLWWDNRPTHTPSFHVHVLFWNPGWTAPESLKAQLDAYKKAAAHARDVATQQTVVITEAGVHDVKVQTQIRYVTKTILKEIPYAVPAAADFRLTTGWVRVHDRAVSGADDNPGLVATDATPSPFGSADGLYTVVTNYGICRANTQQMKDLQQAIRDARAIK